MKIELNYFDMADNNPLFQAPIISDGFQFIPNEGDTLILNNYGYIVSQREFSYDNENTKITIFCVRERKKRN